MNSSWLAEALAVLGKEWRTEMRSRHGLLTGGLFGVLAVVAIGFGAASDKPSATLAAGMLSATLLFAAVTALPRTLLLEDEQGTFELMRLLARPEAAYMGKLLYNILTMAVGSVALGALFITLTSQEATRPLLFVASLVALALAMAAGVTACGALAMGAANRWLLAGAVALPVLLPTVAMGVTSVRAGLGGGTEVGGWQGVVALTGFAIALGALGPVLAGAVWRRG